MSRLTAILCALGLLAVIAIRFAQPIQDGDLFFHLAYARQMLEHHTLIPDHSAFSWTPASNAAIYCAWASELLLFWIWHNIGIAGIFAFRYLCVLIVAALAWNYARQAGLGRSPLTWLALMILVLSSVAGTIVKPELVSLVFFNAMIWLYFQYRLDGRVRWLYLAPVLLLLWVNMHGAFIMAAPFLAATAAGEALSRRLSRHLLLAWSLCGAAVLVTPYGWRYPWQLIEENVLGRIARPDIGWNDAHQSIFAAGAAGLHFVEFLGLMFAVLAVLAWLSHRLDWPIVFSLAVYVPLFLLYLRTTFFLPAVFCYSAFHLARLPSRPLPGWTSSWKPVALSLFLLLGGRAALEAWRNPGYGSWLGFGISYLNPVPEAQFLASAQLGPRIYNLFDEGGYLLWRLYPQYRVMTDSRSFPYLGWFDDQYRFSIGESFDDFLRRYPADVAIIELLHIRTCRNFLRSPEWRLVYYGPSAAVFVKKSVPYAAGRRAAEVEIRNGDTAVRFFDFAAEIGDFRTAWVTLEHIGSRLAHQLSRQELEAVRSYREGHSALRAGDWPRAKRLFDVAFKNKNPGDRDQLIRIFLGNIETLQARGDTAQIATFQTALQKLMAPE